MSRNTYFVDVILPLAVPNLYTYRVPHDWNDVIAIGKRVVVQFGKGRLYSALVRNLHETPPKQYEAKYIDSILDEFPIVNVSQFALWDWISSYYMCHIGDVMIASLPGGFRLVSETKIVINPEFCNSTSENLFDLQLLPKKNNQYFFSEKEHLIIEALEIRKNLTISEISEILDQKTVYPILKTLLEKGVLLIHEELKEKFKPKIESFVRITSFADNEEQLKNIFNSLEKKAHKQLDVLLAFIKLSERYKPQVNKGAGFYVEVKKSDIIKMVAGTEAALKSLVQKNILEIYEREVGRFASFDNSNKISQLNEIQQKAFESIVQQFGWADSINLNIATNNDIKTDASFTSDLKLNKPLPASAQSTKDVVLLHGVTSSGKTEIYVKLIEQVIAQKKQVLYLLPEIALTTQIINRLRKYFGDTVGVYHSKFSGNERVEVWNNVLNFKNNCDDFNSSSSNPEDGSFNSTKGTTNFKLIVGARSSLFLPFSNLGLIIVDEEHDSSYKQYDPAPRYNARDGAIYLAHIHKAKTLLGSATPSLESYYNAQEGKYGFVEINQRFGGIKMPEVIISDVKEATRKKQMKSHFSPILLDSLTLALQNKEQVILFQNRRGFAPQLECNICAWVPKCNNCDVSLTFHKTSNQLRCHYCGYSIKPPNKCGACGDSNLRMKGFGTEKIEEELSIFYPKAKIARMDLDTTRSKFAHQHIIQDFEAGNIDILVGTQMVTKGLDFDNVSMVGILNADNMLNFPDFRSFERSFQLMAQVSGRAGRKSKQGKVVIQTQNPNHSIIQHVINTDFFSMYIQELLDRKNFNYPPYFRLIEITLIHKDIDMVNASSKFLADELKHHFKKRVLGPEFPMVSRIRNLYHKNILLKIERELSVIQAKTILTNIIFQFKSDSNYKSVRVQIDVDPF